MSAAQPPVWVRAMLALDRVVELVARSEAVLRDELLVAFVPAEERDRVTSWVYARQPTYAPGGTCFDTGVFDWEEAVIGAPVFPRTGRVLVGAAGAGREARELIRRGYEVVAFDPCSAFVEASRSVPELSAVPFIVADYDDLTRAVDGQGPLAAELNRAPFDAVILGCASLSHVTEASDRIALLEALRSFAPHAPVLTSFLLDCHFPRSVRLKQVRKALRSFLAPAGAQTRPGLNFEGHSGFTYFFADGEIDRLAAASGYTVERFSATPFAHALLVPAHRVP